MKPEINSVSDLGNDWVVLGTENGDTSVVKLTPKDARKVVFVKAKVPKSGGETEEVVYVIGHRSWILSPVGSYHLTKLADAGLKRQVLPVSRRDLVDQVYSEWSERSKSGEFKKEDQTEKHENIKQVEAVILKCLELGASDIHLEVKEGGAVLRRRINGTLVDFDTLTELKGHEWGRAVYNVLTTVAGVSLKIKNTQDALIERDFGFVKLRARVATAPCHPRGFHMVLRLLKEQSNSKPLTTEELGYSAQEQNNIDRAASRTKGIICFSGTTGSGKSTSLQSVITLKVLERGGNVKVITVEDPPEYVIPAVQIPVIRGDDGDASDAYAGAIRAALRQDPDWLMVGEVRDEQSANLVRTIVDTGHPVYTTVHASGCVQTLHRFINLGVSREALAAPEFISGLFYQKLLPKICPSCAKTIKDGIIPVRQGVKQLLVTLKLYQEEAVDRFHNQYLATKTSSSFLRYLQDNRLISSADAEFVASSYNRFNNPKKMGELLSRIESVSDISSDKILFKGDGCSKCKGTGVIGRTVVSEGLLPDMSMLDMIAEGADKELVAYWRKNQNGKFAVEDAVEKMRAGIVDPIDIELEVGTIGSTYM